MNVKNPNCSLQESKFAYFRIHPLQHIEQQSHMTLASTVEKYQLPSNLQTDVYLVQSGSRSSLHIHVPQQLQPSDKIKISRIQLTALKSGRIYQRESLHHLV